MLNQAMVGQAMGQAMQNEHLPPDALHELQTRRLHDLVRFAAEKSPFYRELYAGRDLDRIQLADLPTVSKPDLQERFDEVVTDPRLKRAGVRAFCEAGPQRGRPFYLDAFAVALSSGTSGLRGHYVMDGPALADAIAMGYRQSNRPAARGDSPQPGGPASVQSPTSPAQPPQQRIAAVMLIEPFDSAGLLMRMIPESLGPKQLIDIRQDFAAICQQLNDFGPTLLSSFPYMLRMLSQGMNDGQLSICPHRITSSGDVLTESDRAAVRRSFGVDPFDYYCCTEATYIAWECEAHEGLHVNADYVLLESVDGDNRTVPAGQLGARSLLTNLTNRAMPLVRYQMSDQVEYMAEPCRCGSRLPRIRTVAGRVEHVLVFPGAVEGKVSLVPEQIDDFVGGLEGLANYQVIQEAPRRLTVNYIPERLADAAEVAAAIRSGLGRCFERYNVAGGVEMDLHQVERLQPILRRFRQGLPLLEPQRLSGDTRHPCLPAASVPLNSPGCWIRWLSRCTCWMTKDASSSSIQPAKRGRAGWPPTWSARSVGITAAPMSPGPRPLRRRCVPRRRSSPDSRGRRPFPASPPMGS